MIRSLFIFSFLVGIRVTFLGKLKRLAKESGQCMFT